LKGKKGEGLLLLVFPAGGGRGRGEKGEKKGGGKIKLDPEVLRLVRMKFKNDKKGGGGGGGKREKKGTFIAG